MGFRTIRPILVTGTQRSGSTWVGKMIAVHPRVLYFSEPFNPARCDLPVRTWWHYVTPRDQQLFGRYLRFPCELRLPWWEHRLDFPANLLRRMWRTFSYMRRRWHGYRPLLKDPIALLSAEWLATQYPTQNVVLIRHPAAYASSLKRLNWWMPVADLLGQEQLMRDWLHPYEAELRRLLHGADIIEHAIVGWRVFHHVIREYQRRHPHWLFCRHEDLSLRPVEEFADIFKFLGLEFTPAVQHAIEQHSDEENPREAGGEVHRLKRNSKANVWNWQQRLTPAEINRIRSGTGELADHFYGDEDWWSPRTSLAA